MWSKVCCLSGIKSALEVHLVEYRSLHKGLGSTETGRVVMQRRTGIVLFTNNKHHLTCGVSQKS